MSGTKEKRKFKRRPILSTFSMAVVIPKKGGHRLTVHDVSDQGLGFDFDLEGESQADFPLKSGEVLDVELYLNQSLYIPLKVKVIRLTQKDSVRQVGAELTEKSTPQHKALVSFLNMLDQITEVAKIDT
jgi:hypothetical protein